MSFVPQFCVGLMADLQFADVPDSVSYVEKTPRRYRQSLSILGKGAEHFRAAGTVLNVLLGDLLDFKAASHAETALVSVLELTQPREKYHFIVGNHDLNVFSRPRIHETYLPPTVQASTPKTGGILYYAHRPAPGWVFLFLDPFEVSAFNAATDGLRREAEELLARNNPNLSGEAFAGNWFVGIPLEQQRYVPYNGCISATQLQWMLDEVSAADAANERVVVFSHLPVYRRCVHPSGLMWNAETVLAAIQRSRSVVAWVSGHDHAGGYAVDEAGIHHMIPPAPLECNEGQVAFGVLTVGSEGAQLQWEGKTPANPGDPWPDFLAWRTR